jgi:hypothetical protein
LKAGIVADVEDLGFHPGVPLGCLGSKLKLNALLPPVSINHRLEGLVLSSIITSDLEDLPLG